MKLKNLTFIIGCLLYSQTFAYDKVSSPNIDKNTLVFENRSGFDSDGKQLNKIIVNYGLTDSIRPEFKTLVSSNSKTIIGYEYGLRFQINKESLPFSIEEIYKTSTQNKISDKLESKLLFSKTCNKVFDILNISIENELGTYSKSGTTLIFGNKLGYKVNTYFEPGIEIYGNTGKLNKELAYNQQKYTIGPAISGNISSDIRYEVGSLYGISDAATRERVKVILTYTKHF